jgi:hypothetical protein
MLRVMYVVAIGANLAVLISHLISGEGYSLFSGAANQAAVVLLFAAQWYNSD